jgi:hypothetical protein
MEKALKVEIKELKHENDVDDDDVEFLEEDEKSREEVAIEEDVDDVVKYVMDKYCFWEQLKGEMEKALKVEIKELKHENDVDDDDVEFLEEDEKSREEVAIEEHFDDVVKYVMDKYCFGEKLCHFMQLLHMIFSIKWLVDIASSLQHYFSYRKGLCALG